MTNSARPVKRIDLKDYYIPDPVVQIQKKSRLKKTATQNIRTRYCDDHDPGLYRRQHVRQQDGRSL